MATATEKPTMVIGIDESEQSYYALEWTLDHFFTPNSPFKLFIVHAKPIASSLVGLAGSGGPFQFAGSSEVLLYMDSDLKRIAGRVLEKAKEICTSKSGVSQFFLRRDEFVDDIVLEVVDGDARNVLCEAVERHHADILVVGSHSYGAIKRAFLGSVSDYCVHHAHCSVMIIKMPKTKH